VGTEEKQKDGWKGREDVKEICEGGAEGRKNGRKEGREDGREGRT
jgi:hypothetical protein